jgi:predicted ATP-dependent endonuclease of OLD family
MKFTYFKFENFKGIESQKIEFNKNSNSNVFTLVGLNESGKSTVLEAINYFAYKKENLNALDLPNYVIEDIHSIIPINKRDNFNGRIQIEAGIELEPIDIEIIKKAFTDKNITLTEFSNKITYTQNYFFENSIYAKDKTLHLWSYDFKGKIGKSKKQIPLKNSDALTANTIIKDRLPSILYFPNFLFEFPERIYLSTSVKEPKYKFYQNIIQDVLDSLENDTNIEDHLISRIQSSDEKEKRNLNSLIGKMQKQLTSVIFTKWNQIFNKEISKTEIVLFHGMDLEQGAYLEFNIKDDVDTYRIIERSLGFRWFFVYILLTQFRTFRKENNNALFLFDEPASNLHPSAQTELLKSFEKLPKVIYTTHSHYLINPKWLENTFVIKNEAIDYEDELIYNSKNTNIKINRYREFAVKHPEQSNYFQPILEVLDYRPSNLELVPNVVITEGKNDFYTLNYFQETIFKSRSLIKIVPGTSSSNLETLISLYLGWGRKFIILLDSDKEGKKQRDRYIEVYGESISDLIITFETINPLWSNNELEDLFSKDDQLLIQQKNYPLETKYKKKTFNRSIQELYMNNEALDFEEETKDNINLVLKFLKSKLK